MSEREREPRIEVRVGASAIRCPYCHGDVLAAANDWVACHDCLARHHEGCWKEHGRCATCGADVALHSRADAPRSVEHELELVKFQNELQRVDDEWRACRDRIAGGRRRPAPAEPGGGMIMGILIALAGIVMTIATLTVPTAHTGPALAVVAGGVFLALLYRFQDARLREARGLYERKRAHLIAERKHARHHDHRHHQHHHKG